MLGNIAETAFHALKIVVIVAVAGVFMVAITNLVFSIENLIFHNVIGEFFRLISMYLPFNANAVFGALGTATISILAFLIAKKIFDLTSWSISSI